MKPKVYLETTIISFLAARPSRDILVNAKQAVTNEWWATQRNDFDLYISEVVLGEISNGDRDAVERRLNVAKGLYSLELTEKCFNIAKQLTGNIIPDSVAEDAYHVSLAIEHNIEYLLTWNMKHINKTKTKYAIMELCNLNEYNCPVICSPFEMIEVKKQ